MIGPKISLKNLPLMKLHRAPLLKLSMSLKGLELSISGVIHLLSMQKDLLARSMLENQI